MDLCVILGYFIWIVLTGSTSTINKVHVNFLVLRANINSFISAMFECQLFKAWKDAGAKAIIDEAPKKQKRDGWDSTRNALATTIRYNSLMTFWVLCLISTVQGLDYLRYFCNCGSKAHRCC